MSLLEGKVGIIMGVANQKSIATHVAQACAAQGAKLLFSHLPDEQGKMRKRAESAIGELDPLLLEPCNVADDESIDSFFTACKSKVDKVDFLIHSLAFADADQLRRPTTQVSRQGFLDAMNISAYSLLAVSQKASELMTEGGSIVAMTYLGGERVIPGYNLMGVCKAALDQCVRYAAHDLGPRNIRVNAISAGPLRTLASSAVGDFKKMLSQNAASSPLKRNITADEVGSTALYLASSLSSGMTGELLHVDAGYHIMSAPPITSEH